MVYQSTESIRMGITSHLIAGGYPKMNNKLIGAHSILIRRTMRYKMGKFVRWRNRHGYTGAMRLATGHGKTPWAVERKYELRPGGSNSRREARRKSRAIDRITSSTKHLFHARCKSVPAQTMYKGESIWAGVNVAVAISETAKCLLGIAQNAGS